jgi:hydrogenase maturation protease
VSQRVLIIGVGNRYRRDDAAGLHVAAHIAEHAPQGVDTVCCEDDLVVLMDLWHGAGRVVIVDATVTGARPGTIRRFEIMDHLLPPDGFVTSTHFLGLAHVIDLARALERLPPKLIAYGLEGSDFLTGEGLTPEVEHAVGRAAQLILDDIKNGI